MNVPGTIGRYKILKLIAEGSMGALYLANDPTLNRLVAIKLLREDGADTELRDRFVRQAAAIGQLRHQHIVMVFDVGHDAGRPFMAMEYVEGFTFASVIRERQSLAIDQKLRWLMEVCDGLAYMHKHGIIHRNIKPANVMVDDEDLAKIVDFSAARSTRGAQEAAGTLVGTLSYMSPEQMNGRGVDHRTDIFGVGALCYEFLAYRRAFPGDIQDGVLHRILNEPPPPLAQLVPEIDPQLVAIVNKALEKDRNVRYQDLIEMKNDLAAVRSRLQRQVESPTAPFGYKSDGGAILHPQMRFAAPPTQAMPKSSVLERAARRRAYQIEDLLDTATKAIAAGAMVHAQDLCEQVLVLEPNNPAALALHDRAQSAGHNRKAARLERLVDEARQALRTGAFDTAQEVCEQILIVEPHHAEAIALYERAQQAIEREQKPRPATGLTR